MERYLQQLAELELLLSEVRAGGGTQSQELEGRMLAAEETLRTILREALSLQGTSCPPLLDGAIWAVPGRVLLAGLSQQVSLQPFSLLLTSLRQVSGSPCGQDEGARVQLPESLGRDQGNSGETEVSGDPV